MDHDDFQPREPVKGLPEVPPEGEHILWQGKPDWWSLAKDALLIRWVMVYFAFLALWRLVGGWLDGDLSHGIEAATVLVVMGAVAGALLALCAWVQAWATVYTITNRRVVMRIGAALTVSLNLPYRWIGSADLKLYRNGRGTISFDLIGETRFSYLVCWPHVRPWHMTRTQPSLRCIKDAEAVAVLIRDNARMAVTTGAPARGQSTAIPAE